MSWAQVQQPYRRYEKRSQYDYKPGARTPSFPVSIWEATDEHPNGHKVVESQEFDPSFVSTPAKVRIITAPLDRTEPSVAPGTVKLCKALKIPGSFLNERVQDVCHSFGACMEAESDSDISGGFVSWFHYTCKYIDPSRQRDSGWLGAGYFLRKHGEKEGGGVTLVVFGCLKRVQERLQLFMDEGCWEDVIVEPLALFQLVLEGLFRTTDDSMWYMVEIINKLQKEIDKASSSPKTASRRIIENIDVSKLHYWTLQLINLGEAIDSCLLLVDDMVATVDRQEQQRERQLQLGQHLAQQCPSSPSTTLTTSSTICHRPVNPHTQLRDNLLYIRSLFRNTRLRLNNMQKRVDNMRNLAFHLVTQQDSRLMVRDSASMTVISFITAIFLPTVSIATIIGSQLFETEFPKPEGKQILEPEVHTSPLFKQLWAYAIPFTVAIAFIALEYRRRAIENAEPKAKKARDKQQQKKETGSQANKEEAKGWWQRVTTELSTRWNEVVDISQKGWLGQGLKKMRRLKNRLWQPKSPLPTNTQEVQEVDSVGSAHPSPPTQPKAQPPHNLRDKLLSVSSTHSSRPSTSQSANRTHASPATLLTQPPGRSSAENTNPGATENGPRGSEAGSQARRRSLPARIGEGNQRTTAPTSGGSAVDRNGNQHSKSTAQATPGVSTRRTH